MTKIIKRSYDDVAPEDKQHMIFNKWFPDTCDCAHEFFWDRRTNEDNREHHPHQSIRVCDHHIHHTKALTVSGELGMNEHVFDHLMEVQQEAWHKCGSIAHVLECLGDDHKIFIENDDGTIVPWFKKVPDWSFEYKTSNKVRDLHLTVHKATADEKVKIATILKRNYPKRTVHLK